MKALLSLLFVFTCNQILLSQQNMFLVGQCGENIGYTPLLDDYPGAIAAYSVRLLNSSYLGPGVTIQRSTDAATQDIYYCGSGNLDIDAVDEFLGVASGIVTVWHDQSGNNNDANWNSSNGFYINRAGAVPFLEARAAAISQYNTGLYLSDITIFFAADTRAYAYPGMNYAARMITSYVGTGPLAASDKIFDVYNQNTTPVFRFRSSGVTVTNNTYTPGMHIHYGLGVNGKAITLGWDGANTTIGATHGSTINVRAIHLFEDTGGSNIELLTSVFEIIIYNSDQSANRTAIEGNMNSYYSIY